MRSSLGKLLPTSAMSDDELYAKKKEAHDLHDILVVLPEQRAKLPNKLAEASIQIGHYLYGVKHGR